MTTTGKQLTAGERLRKALALAGIGVREFQRRMEARGVKGSSYANLHRYLSGEEPSLDFIRHAADVLGVRAAWLALDDGAPTVEEEEARRRASAASVAMDEPMRRIVDAILEELPPGLRPSASLYTLLIRTWGVLFDEMEASNAWDAFMLSGTADPPTTLEEKQVRVARMLGRALAAPARISGGDAAVWGWSADQYIAHVCEALLWLRIPFVEPSGERETKASAKEQPAGSRKAQTKKRPAKRAAKKAKPRRKR